MLDLDKMTVKELRQYARENGMSSICRLVNATQLRRAIRRFEVPLDPSDYADAAQLNTELGITRRME